MEFLLLVILYGLSSHIWLYVVFLDVMNFILLFQGIVQKEYGRIGFLQSKNQTFEGS